MVILVYRGIKLLIYLDFHLLNAVQMDMANKNAVFNPRPPFYRGEEVATDVINSNYFVGYEFKKSLLEVQQAIIIINMIKY